MEAYACYKGMGVVRPQWVKEVVSSYEGDAWATEKLIETLISPANAFDVSETEGLLRYNQRLYIGVMGKMRRKLMVKMHGFPLGRHSDQQGTCQRLK